MHKALNNITKVLKLIIIARRCSDAHRDLMVVVIVVMVMVMMVAMVKARI